MGINDFVNIGSKIKKERIEKGLKQKEVAQQLGIPISTYANYENNHREPPKEIIQLLANLFDVPMYTFINVDNLRTQVEKYEQFDRSFNSDMGTILEFLINQLESENYDLKFEGADLDDELREVLKNSLTNIYETAKLLNKK